MIVRIDDPDDPRIAAYRDIRERDLVGRKRRFIAEGKVVLNVLFQARRFEAESVLVLESRLAGLQPVLKQAPAATPVYVASAGVLDRIAGYHVHRGVLAIGLRRRPQSIEELLAEMPPQALVVALAGIANHDNMGAIFRNAAAFEADAVLLDRSCCDPLYRKSIRVSVGAVLKVPFAQDGDAAGLAENLQRHGFDLLALSPRGELDMAQAERGARVALLLGAEGDGLPPALLARLKTARIAMSGGFDSLNVAAASAIALHRLWRGGIS